MVKKYNEEVKPKMIEEFGMKNELSIPRITKIVINVGVGEAKDNAAVLEAVKTNVASISGQLPMVTKAKKSISAFKLVQGQPIGVMVTLRSERMYAFLDKLINAVLPKVRDFRGVPGHAFDGQGNYNLGLREQIIFPEVDYKTANLTRGLQITIATTAKTKEQGYRLLELFGMPFAKGAN